MLLDLSFSLHNIPGCDMIQCHLQCLVLKFWFQAEQKQSEKSKPEKLEIRALSRLPYPNTVLELLSGKEIEFLLPIGVNYSNK